VFEDGRQNSEERKIPRQHGQYPAWRLQYEGESSSRQLKGKWFYYFEIQILMDELGIRKSL